MTEEHDYKKACEILQQALWDADRILRRANLRVSLQMEREAGRLGYDEGDEEDPA
jgi:hypothetical protein